MVGEICIAANNETESNEITTHSRRHLFKLDYNFIIESFLNGLHTAPCRGSWGQSARTLLCCTITGVFCERFACLAEFEAGVLSFIVLTWGMRAVAHALQFFYRHQQHYKPSIRELPTSRRPSALSRCACCPPVCRWLAERLATWMGSISNAYL